MINIVETHKENLLDVFLELAIFPKTLFIFETLTKFSTTQQIMEKGKIKEAVKLEQTKGLRLRKSWALLKICESCTPLLHQS